MSFESDTHTHEDQIGRQKRALERKCTPLELNREEKSATFKGSGKKNYYTTCKGCTCADFAIRGLPCKHMYRLFFELGVLNPDASLQGDVIEFDSELLSPLSEDAKKELYDLLNLWISSSSENEWIYDKNEQNCQTLIENGFLRVIEADQKLLAMRSMNELREELRLLGLKAPRSKASAIEALIEANPDSPKSLRQKYLVVAFDEKWRPFRGKIRNYLKSVLPRKEVEVDMDLGFERKESWAHFVREI